MSFLVNLLSLTGCFHDTVVGLVFLPGIGASGIDLSRLELKEA